MRAAGLNVVGNDLLPMAKHSDLIGNQTGCTANSSLSQRVIGFGLRIGTRVRWFLAVKN
jgi:hypothetical protein